MYRIIVIISFADSLDIFDLISQTTTSRYTKRHRAKTVSNYSRTDLDAILGRKVEPPLHLLDTNLVKPEQVLKEVKKQKQEHEEEESSEDEEKVKEEKWMLRNDSNSNNRNSYNSNNNGYLAFLMYLFYLILSCP